jgi:hypothetical protein
LSDIEWAKNHIKKHPPQSAKGNDDISYRGILDIPNEHLLTLFQSCIDSRNAPEVWLTTIIVVILKTGKPG